MRKKQDIMILCALLVVLCIGLGTLGAGIMLHVGAPSGEETPPPAPPAESQTPEPPAATPEPEPQSAATAAPTSTPQPTPEPVTPTQPPRERIAPVSAESLDKAAAYVAGMADDLTKVYQLFIVNPDAVTGRENTNVAGDVTREALSRRPVCGMIYQSNNMLPNKPEDFLKMVQGQQSIMEENGFLPLITCVDEEGGRVCRIRELNGLRLDAMFSYREDGPGQAAENARTLAAWLRELGLNTDLAPVADVWSNPENEVIGDRAYSDSFEEAAELVAAAVSGFREGGATCCLKHFPGHGDTLEDSHEGPAVVTKTLDQLRREEFLPFQAGIDAGADMVMLGHLSVRNEPELADNPATFSPRIVDILRSELGFSGVIITDSLSMGAVTAVSGEVEACKQALAAGCDILLGVWDQETLDRCANAIREAADEEIDGVSWDRIDDSLVRIIAMKYERGILED